MEMHDLIKLTAEELTQKMRELEEELRSFRFQAGNMQLKTVRKMREVRKDIARVHTALTQIKSSTK